MIEEHEIVAAFKRARTGAGVDGPRAIRHAGTLAAAVPRERGTRSSTSALTMFCAVAGVKRQTDFWMQVARLPGSDFEAYCADVEQANGRSSIRGVLRISKVKAARPAKAHTGHMLFAKKRFQRIWSRTTCD